MNTVNDLVKKLGYKLIHSPESEGKNKKTLSRPHTVNSSKMAVKDGSIVGNPVSFIQNILLSGKIRSVPWKTILA